MPASPVEILTILPVHTLITLVFYLAAIVYLVFTTIMYYHWHEYSFDDGVTRITSILYLLTTVPLILTLGLVTFLI